MTRVRIQIIEHWDVEMTPNADQDFEEECVRMIYGARNLPPDEVRRKGTRIEHFVGQVWILRPARKPRVIDGNARSDRDPESG